MSVAIDTKSMSFGSLSSEYIIWDSRIVSFVPHGLHLTVRFINKQIFVFITIQLFFRLFHFLSPLSTRHNCTYQINHFASVFYLFSVLRNNDPLVTHVTNRVTFSEYVVYDIFSKSSLMIRSSIGSQTFFFYAGAQSIHRLCISSYFFPSNLLLWSVSFFINDTRRTDNKCLYGLNFLKKRFWQNNHLYSSTFLFRWCWFKFYLIVKQHLQISQII